MSGESDMDYCVDTVGEVKKMLAHPSKFPTTTVVCLTLAFSIGIAHLVLTKATFLTWFYVFYFALMSASLTFVVVAWLTDRYAKYLLREVVSKDDEKGEI
jgi:hypothetical protein